MKLQKWSRTIVVKVFFLKDEKPSDASAFRQETHQSNRCRRTAPSVLILVTSFDDIHTSSELSPRQTALNGKVLETNKKGETVCCERPEIFFMQVNSRRFLDSVSSNVARHVLAFNSSIELERRSSVKRMDPKVYEQGEQIDDPAYLIPLFCHSLGSDQWRIQDFSSTGQIPSRPFLVTGQ